MQMASDGSAHIDGTPRGESAHPRVNRPTQADFIVGTWPGATKHVVIGDALEPPVDQEDPTDE